MNDRAKIFLGALACLFIVVVLLMPPATHTLPASKPLSTDRGDFGLMGLKRWLEHNGIETVSLRRRYTALADIAGAGPSLLITSLPHGVPARSRELQALQEWVESGNTVLLLTSARDMPEWRWMGKVRFGAADTPRVLRRFGFEFDHPDDGDAEETGNAGNDAGAEKPDEGASLKKALAAAVEGPKRHELSLRPRLDHPRVRGVREVTTRSLFEQPGEVRLSGLEESNLALALLEHRDSGQPVFWEAPLGRGLVWVSAYPDLFGNITLGEADNARFLTGLLRAGLGESGRVVFDDFHFGLSDLYDPAAFFADRRLHATLLFILAFWFAYVLGRTNRLAPPRTRRPAPRESDFVEALAGLCARRLKRRAVAAGLAAHFFNELRRRHRRPENGRPAWELLDRHAAVPADDLREFRRLVEAAESGGAVRLNRFTRLMNNIRNAL